MDAAQTDFSSLEYLLKAPSKDFINRLILEAFNTQVVAGASPINHDLLRTISESLEIDRPTSEKLMNDLAQSIKQMMFNGLSDLAEIQSMFDGAGSLQSNLKNLLGKLLLEKQPLFKKRLVDDQNLMPKLVDFNWRVDIKMASNIGQSASTTMSSSDAGSKLGQQACILQLKIQDAQKFEHETPNVESLNLELSKQTLTTMFDALTKIKDQLSSIASK